MNAGKEGSHPEQNTTNLSAETQINQPVTSKQSLEPILETKKPDGTIPFPTGLPSDVALH